MILEQVFGIEDVVPQSSLGEHTQGEAHVPTVAEEPNLEVLGSTAVALGTEFNALSFRWAMGAGFIQKQGMAITMIWRE
jgi:hypothetical protein